jgi:hypothetical protein
LLHPEHDQACIRISPSHIVDELDFFRRVLIWVTVRTMRPICRGLKRSIILLRRRYMYCRLVLQRIAAFVTPYFREYSIIAFLYRIV